MNVAFLRTQTPVDQPEIRVSGYFYFVDFGVEIEPRYHHVGINSARPCATEENHE